MNLADGNGRRVTMVLTIQTKGLAHLSELLKKIDAVKGVISVSRIGDDVSKQGPADSSSVSQKTEDIGSK
jgi:hypothetical protein